MADTNINEINEAADNGTFLQAAFEVIVSNSKNNDTQNVTGVAVDGSGNPIQAVSGDIYVIDDTTLNEGYTAASLKNTNTVYMKISAKSAVDGRPGDHTGLYVHNTYDVNKITDGSLVVNFPGKTLGLVTLAGERSDYTELIVGEKYKFAISNFYEAATYEVGDTFTVKNGVWKETASASITAGDVYSVLTKISSFTEGGLYAGDGYILEIKRKAVADTVGSVVVANPTLAGTEPDLTGLEVDGDKYKLPAGAFVCTFTKSGNTISCDKTRAEILAAYDAGKTIYGKANLYSMFSPQLLGIGIFKLENVDETNNRHVKFVCNAIVPYNSEQEEVTLATPSILYLYGTTVLGYYYWQTETVPLPPVPTVNQAGKAYSVDDYGVAGWGSKAVPIPKDISLEKLSYRTLRAYPSGYIEWSEETMVTYASDIIDDNDTGNLNDYFLLAVQSFVTSAIANPGTFTVTTTTTSFSSSMSFDDNIIYPALAGENFAIAFTIDTTTIVVKPNYCALHNHSFMGISIHLAGTLSWQSTNVNLNADVIIRPNAIIISGFAST